MYIKVGVGRAAGGVRRWFRREGDGERGGSGSWRAVVEEDYAGLSLGGRVELLLSPSLLLCERQVVSLDFRGHGGKYLANIQIWF